MMNLNKEIYPDNYGTFDTSNAFNDLELLQKDLLKNIFKQIKTLRIAGENAIKNQHRLLRINPFRLTVREAGKNLLFDNDFSLKINENQLFEDLKGESGFFISGDRITVNNQRKGLQTGSIERFSYLGELLSLNSNHLSKGVSLSGATGNNFRGWISGGWDEQQFSSVNTIESINYSEEKTTTHSISLSAPRYSLSAGGNSAHGYFFYGFTNDRNVPEYPISQNIEKLNYLSETINAIASQLVVARSINNNLKGSKKELWLFNGIKSDWSISTGIEKFDFLTESCSSLSIETLDSLANYASAGNENWIYLLGGRGDNSLWSSGSRRISRFSLSDSSFSTLSNQLSTGKTNANGINSNKLAYIGGGLRQGNLATNTIEKLNLNNSQINNIGVFLNVNRGNGNSLSDYGESFF